MVTGGEKKGLANWILREKLRGGGPVPRLSGFKGGEKKRNGGGRSKPSLVRGKVQEERKGLSPLGLAQRSPRLWVRL